MMAGYSDGGIRMKLEINGEVVSDEVDAEGIKDAMHALNADGEAIIVLTEREGVFLQAAGTPTTGFVMGYHNGATSEELASTNQTLKPMAVLRAFTSFARGNADWRGSIGWEPSGAYVAKAYNWRATWRRMWPLYVGLLFFTIAIVPLAMATKSVIDQVVFKPLCEQDSGRTFSHFQQGSGNGNVSTPFTPGTCWYEGGENITLRTLQEGADLIDLVAKIAQVVVPIIVIVVIELVGFLLWRGRKYMAA